MDKTEQQKLIADAKLKLTRALVALGKIYTESELTYLGVILEGQIKSIITVCLAELPQSSPSRYKLRCNNGSVGGYHPVNGVWYQLYQVANKEGKINYYTNGVLETKNLNYSGELRSEDQVD
jgi:hypothetical protein